MANGWLRKHYESAEEGLLRHEDGQYRAAMRSVPALPVTSVPGVYFLSAVGVNLVKIGTVRHSGLVEKRIDTLQAGCPYLLKLIVIAPNHGRATESKLHKRFCSEHFRGEWYACAGDLKLFLQRAVADGVGIALADIVMQKPS